MEEREITPQESMAIITGMIQSTHHRIAMSGLRVSIMWATVSILSAVAVFVLLATTRNPEFNYFWLAIPVIGFPLNIIMLRKRGMERTVKTFVDTVCDRIWKIVALTGITLMVMCAIFNVCYSSAGWIAMFFYAFIVVGFGAAAQGVVIRENAYVLGGVISIVCGFALGTAMMCGVSLRFEWVIPLYIVCFLLMFVVPAFIVARHIRNDNDERA